MDSVQILLNCFPDCPREHLLSYFEDCQRDLDYVVNNLLDSGYVMNGNGQTPEPSVSDTSDNDQQIDDIVSKSINVKNETVAVATETIESETEKYKRLGARPKIPNSNSSPSSSGSSRISGSSENAEIEPWEDFVWGPPNPDEDWIELELPFEFVKSVSEIFGGDVRDKDNFRINRLTKKDRTIKVPPDLAFDIYRYLNVNVDKLQKQAQEQEWFIDNNEATGGHFRFDQLFPFAIDDEIKCTEIEMIFQQISDLENKSSAGLSFSQIQDRDKTIAEQSNRIKELYAIKRTLAQIVKFAQLQHSFPSLKRETIEDVFVQCELNFEKSLKYLKDMYPQKFVEYADKQQETLVCQNVYPVMDPVRPQYLQYDPEEVAKMNQSDKRYYLDLAAIWKTEFEELQKCVTNYREKMVECRKQFDVLHYFREKGNDLHAKLNLAQKEYQFYTVFGSNAGGDPNKIDLHGLTVKYALQVVAAYLQNRTDWAKNNLPENQVLRVRIITGRGKHSVNRIPRLNPAVRSYLFSHHYSFTDGDIDHDGSFTVHLGKKAVKVIMSQRHRRNN